MKMYILNNKEYRTKKNITEYFKNKKDEYNIGTSLKNTDIDFFNDIIALFKHHDDAESKLKDMIDIVIGHNDKKQNVYLILKSNEKLITISYIHCIDCIGKPIKEIKKRNQISNLNVAMRFAIKPQIESFIRNNKNKCCEFCNTRQDIQVDHIILFNQLQKDFFNITKLNGISIPISFIKYNKLNKYIFKKEDEKFKQEWIEYHKKNATLRYLCGNCNRCRKKK